MYASTRRAIAALSVPMFLLAAGCAGTAEAGASVDVTAEDSGRTITLRPSDRLAVTLDSNASTGFRWTLQTAPDPAVLTLVDFRYVAPETELLGAPGSEVWTFEPTGPGTARIALRYERSSGETEGEPFVLTVEVGAEG